MTDREKPNQPMPGTRGTPAREDAHAMQELIGRQLKTMFSEVLSEPVPEKLRDLLEELEKKEQQK
jgi:hypothetical protein